MLEERDAMMLVRAELCERLDALRSLRRISAKDIVEAIAPMRALAANYGLTPVVRLAEALERRMALEPRHGHRCPTALYLDRFHDAIGCTRFDDQASEALLASVSVRLGA